MHALETGSAGQVAFASREVPAWHLLGTVFDGDEAVSTRQMLDLAYLSGWNVRLEDLALRSGLDAAWAQEAYAVVRDNPFDKTLIDVLAVVGGRYKVVQNEDLFAFGDTLLDGGGQWETAGSIRNGRVVFGSLLLPTDIVIGKGSAEDRVQTYLLVTTSHDGTVGVQAATTPVRVVCQNTLNMALRGVKQSFKMRHTTKIDGRVAQAREALDLSFAYADAFAAEAEALFQTEVTNRDFHNIISSLYPKPEDEKKAAVTRWENKVNLLGDLFVGAADAGGVEGAPVTGANITGTAWGALNALTERLDWYRTPREGNADNVAEAASGFSPIVNAEKERIRKAVLTFAQSRGAKVLV
jgi:phage/plasmid-like protein (TIGR03299 family)